MKRLIPFIFVFIMSWGNPADYFQVIVNGVDMGDYSAPMAYPVDYLPEGTHHVIIVPHIYTEHIPVQIDMTINKKENRKFEFWEMIPQPGDEEFFNPDLLKLKEKK